MTRLRQSCLIAISLTIALSSGAQQTGNPALMPLSFLSGRWLSEEHHEMQEETWSPVSGDSMTGSFRVVKDGTPVFYEFWAVEMDGKRPVLKLKHFNANLAGWEEKNASTKMPLISSSEGDAIFAEADGSVSLHYHRTGDKLTCNVHHVRDGKSSDELFAMTRARASKDEP